jgi:hypothetical protein
MSAQVEFEPDFADPTEWARMYRAAGLQVVPAMTPSENRQQWKRPALPKWRALEHELAPDLTFERWYGENGEHARRNNMGMITGACSGGAFMIDLDMHKNPAAAQWWRGILALHNMGGEIETPSQITGGGGRQILFLAPPGWTPPTCKTSIGVDIRGQGGFAMLPPSMHESGTPYRWAAGLEPWETPIAVAPLWLCEEIDALAKEHGGSTSSSSPVERTQTPEAAKDGFGRIVDGREDYATRMIWARVVDEYRQCPIKPGPTEQENFMKDLFMKYDRAVRSRIVERGTPNHILLEREGRGITMFRQKWKAAFDQWEDKVAKHAEAPPPKKDGPKPSSSSGGQASGQAEGEPKGEPDAEDITAEFREDFNVFEVLDVPGILDLPDPAWLVEGIVIENALGFVFGAPGCGKSFIALSQALSLATGQPDWWGRKITRNGPVVYISSEGVGDMKFRLQAWKAATGVNIREAPFFLIRQSINFMLESDVDKLVRTVQSIVDKTGEFPAAVYVDTVSRVLPGADENLQKDMTLFIAACDAVRETFGATVTGVHHTSRAGNLRGSTVFDGAGDFLLHIEREQGEPVGYLTAHKIKAAQDGWKQPFELVEQPIGDIKGTTSLFARPCDEPVKDKAAWPDKETCRQIVAAIGSAWNAGKPWSSMPQSRKQGRYAAAIIKQQFDILEATAELMIQTWLQNDVLSYEMRDKNTKLQGLRVVGSID